MNWIRSLGCTVAVSFQMTLSALPIVERHVEDVDVTGLSALLGVPQGGDLVAYTQAHWLRGNNKERWEMAELSPEQREIVLDWGKTHGIYAAWTPSETCYDAALIFGASTGLMKARLAYLIELVQKGVHVDEIVFLVGERPLAEAVDDLFGICSDEAAAARYLAEHTQLPDEVKQLPIRFVSVPMKEAQNGKRIRPTTADTLYAWLQEKPEKEKKVLLISNQPFNGYQYAVTDGIFPHEILFEVVGPGASNPASHRSAAAITLDSLARWLYQERENQNKGS